MSTRPSDSSRPRPSAAAARRTARFRPSWLDKMHRFWCAANYLTVGQIYLRDNPLLREPLAVEHIKPRLLGHWGTSPGLELRLRASQPPDQAARAQRDLRHRSRPRRARAQRLAPIWKAPTARCIPTSRRTKAGMRLLFRQFSTPGGVPSHAGPHCPARSTKGASSAIRCCMPTAPPSTIPTCWWPASSATAKPRPARWPEVGRATSFSIPVRDGAVLPDPAPERLQDLRPHGAGPHSAAKNCWTCCAATATSRTWSKGTTRPRCTSSLPPRSIAATTRSAPFKTRPARSGFTELGRLADDHPAHAQGLDRAQGGRRRAGRRHLSRAPGAAGQRARQSRASEDARSVDAKLQARRSCSTSAARLIPELAALPPTGRPPDERQSARQRRARVWSSSTCPTSPTTRSDIPGPGPGDRPRRRASWANSCAT